MEDVFAFLEFLFLITSDFNERGRQVPCNLRNSPHALHKVLPSASLLQSGVAVVLQLKHRVTFFGGNEELDDLISELGPWLLVVLL